MGMILLFSSVFMDSCMQVKVCQFFTQTACWGQVTIPLMWHFIWNNFPLCRLPSSYVRQRASKRADKHSEPFNLQDETPGRWESEHLWGTAGKAKTGAGLPGRFVRQLLCHGWGSHYIVLSRDLALQETQILDHHVWRHPVKVKIALFK